ncbi:MAG: helix-turn-helix domain-containing protein [Gemmataceae bacterium]|nr:helix-turn-helix domain-containing protein [Gemmataceae bacterium]
MDAQETLGQRLQRLRAAAGLTQAQAAAAAEVPLSSLQNWEIDRREPGLRAACRLARALGVSAEVLADTAPVAEVGRAPRPAGPTRRAEPPPAVPKKGKGRKGHRGK